MDYDQLVKDIFESNRIISWWQLFLKIFIPRFFSR